MDLLSILDLPEFFAKTRMFLSPWLDGILQWWLAFMCVIAAILGLTRFGPVALERDASVGESFARTLRVLSYSAVGVGFLVAVTLVFAYAAGGGLPLVETFAVVGSDFWDRLKSDGWLILATLVIFRLPREIVTRYLAPIVSDWWRNISVRQREEAMLDIRDTTESHFAKDFLPTRYYRPGQMFYALDEDEKPIYLGLKDWCSTNMQVLGPTRTGKGVLLGNMLDQAIRQGLSAVYVDPKGDEFLPYIMYEAAKSVGRPFLYLDLNDDGDGAWAPFEQGKEQHRWERVKLAYAMAETGNAGVDFHKSREAMAFRKHFKKTQSIPELLKAVSGNEVMKRLEAGLDDWSYHESLCPAPGTGFDIDQAILSDAVVYVKGSMTDSVVTMATTVFIAAVIQAGDRLKRKRKTHLYIAVDEVSALVTTTLSKALATVLQARMSFTLAYQSQDDLKNLQDASMNGDYIQQAINVNSLVKVMYGGPDFLQAKWFSDLSGTTIQEVSKMEKTERNRAGGEEWKGERFMSKEEIPLVQTNTLLGLPPRVCAIKIPGKVTKIAYTAWIPVADRTAVDALAGIVDEAEEAHDIEMADTEPDARSDSGRSVVGDAGGRPNRSAEDPSEMVALPPPADDSLRMRIGRWLMGSAVGTASSKPEEPVASLEPELPVAQETPAPTQRTERSASTSDRAERPAPTASPSSSEPPAPGTSAAATEPSPAKDDAGAGSPAPVTVSKPAPGGWSTQAAPRKKEAPRPASGKPPSTEDAVKVEAARAAKAARQRRKRHNRRQRELQEAAAALAATADGDDDAERESDSSDTSHRKPDPLAIDSTTFASMIDSGSAGSDSDAAAELFD